MGDIFTSLQVVAFIATFILTVIAGPFFIPLLRRLKFGQTVRDDGPATHLKKMGTPVMGGVIFLIPIILVGLYFSRKYPDIAVLMLVMVGFAAIGFIDDMIKVVLKRKDGLSPMQKTVLQVAVSLVFAFYAAYSSKLGTGTVIPFLGMDHLLVIPVWIYIPVLVAFLYFMTNAVNLNDGVDGLASSVTLVVAIFLTLVAMTRSEWDAVRIFSASVAGGCLGFLIFNAHPAKVFMGDTGSLGLGGALVAAVVLMKMPLILVLAGGIYVLEAFSVMIQVAYFKKTRKRFFKMAPLHHHFELSGWKENKVVIVFMLTTVVLCMISLAALGVKLG